MDAFYKEYRRGNTAFTLRDVRAEDARQFLGIIRTLDQETTFLSRAPGEFALTEEEERGFLQKLIDDPLQRMLVAEVNGEIVGSCNTIISGMRRQRHTAGCGIALLKKAWSLGIGRTMMEEMIALLRGEGVERLQLTVDTKNLRAIALYQRYGFIVEGCIRKDRRMEDGSYRDTYHMALDLTEG